jgi:hypothetical protein
MFLRHLLVFEHLLELWSGACIHADDSRNASRSAPDEAFSQPCPWRLKHCTSKCRRQERLLPHSTHRHTHTQGLGLLCLHSSFGKERGLLPSQPSLQIKREGGKGVSNDERERLMHLPASAHHLRHLEEGRRSWWPFFFWPCFFPDAPRCKCASCGTFEERSILEV